MVVNTTGLVDGCVSYVYRQGVKAWLSPVWVTRKPERLETERYLIARTTDEWSKREEEKRKENVKQEKEKSKGHWAPSHMMTDAGWSKHNFS